jgi:hypothetical protein
MNTREISKMVGSMEDLRKGFVVAYITPNLYPCINSMCDKKATFRLHTWDHDNAILTAHKATFNPDLDIIPYCSKACLVYHIFLNQMNILDIMIANAI